MKRSTHAARSAREQLSGIFFTLAVGIGIGLTVIGLGALNKPVQPASAAPAVQLRATTLENMPISLADYRGQVVLVNFWATWCPPCRAEMPAIQDAYSTYHDRGFLVLAVNASESPAEIRPFVERMGLTFPILLDQTEALQQQFEIDSFPTSLFFGPDGAIYSTHTGAMSADLIRSTIETGLARRQ